MKKQIELANGEWKEINQTNPFRIHHVQDRPNVREGLQHATIVKLCVNQPINENGQGNQLQVSFQCRGKNNQTEILNKIFPLTLHPKLELSELIDAAFNGGVACSVELSTLLGKKVRIEVAYVINDDGSTTASIEKVLPLSQEEILSAIMKESIAANRGPAQIGTRRKRDL